MGGWEWGEGPEAEVEGREPLASGRDGRAVAQGKCKAWGDGVPGRADADRAGK